LQQAHRPAARLPAPITAAPPLPPGSQHNPRPTIQAPSTNQHNGIGEQHTTPEPSQALRPGIDSAARGGVAQLRPAVSDFMKYSPYSNQVQIQEHKGSFYFQPSPKSPQPRDRSCSRDYRQRRYERGGELSRRQTTEQEEELPYED